MGTHALAGDRTAHRQHSHRRHADTDAKHAAETHDNVLNSFGKEKGEKPPIKRGHSKWHWKVK